MTEGDLCYQFTVNDHAAAMSNIDLVTAEKSRIESRFGDKLIELLRDEQRRTVRMSWQSHHDEWMRRTNYLLTMEIGRCIERTSYFERFAPVLNVPQPLPPKPPKPEPLLKRAAGFVALVWKQAGNPEKQIIPKEWITP